MNKSIEEVGIISRLSSLENKIMVVVDQAEDNSTRIEELEAMVSSMNEDITFLQGVVQTQDKQIQHLKDKTIDLTARSMRNNIVIARLEGDTQEENCMVSVFSFLQNKLKMEVEEVDIKITSVWCQMQQEAQTNGSAGLSKVT